MATCLSTRPSPRIAKSARLSWHRMKPPGVRCSRSSQMLPSPTSTIMILNGTLSAKFSPDCAELFMTLLLSSNSRSSGQSTRVYGLSLTIQILRTTMHCSDSCSHADASSRSNCPLMAMALMCSYEIFCIDAPATLLCLRTCRLSKVKRLACTRQTSIWQQRCNAQRHLALDNSALAR
jgi:hypothetical protein